MKKWVFLLCLVLAVYVYIKDSPFFQDRGAIQPFHQRNNVHIETRGTAENNLTKTITIAKEQIYQGNLLLINSTYPVRQEGVRSDIVNVAKHAELLAGYGLHHQNMYLSKEVAQKFSEMVKDAEKDGVNHFLMNSGYRTVHEQNQLYAEMGPAHSLPGGYSEHNSGLALDVGSSVTKMERAAEGKWLKENAWKYGFILRYPEDKTDVTGIQYEPWHIRYVGWPHSAIMNQANFVLEEYLDFLKEQQSITVTIDNQVYNIYYYPVSQATTIPVPEHGHYEISGNNMDGVIVTSCKGCA
ncbi:MAG: VanY-A/VanY-F/VanY-M family D-Ala-D-Ala carboxypeptidase [Brevibacillus sp.]|nr:MAG: VanY-A/VanY-F/VanY-M family D-Ala-D-Ala carboxypeptidase [Brevibacillus sp.]